MTSWMRCETPWATATLRSVPRRSPWRGAAKRAVIRHFVDLQSKLDEASRQKLSAEIYWTFVEQVNEAYKTVPPIEGAEEAIRKLREGGYLVATTTGFDREIVMPIFHRLGWEKYFAAMVASDDVVKEGPFSTCCFTPWKQQA